MGNLGSKQRFDYSAIGDEVNVTSRLEGLTKLHGLPAVAGELTVNRCPGLAVLEIDLIKVKGRARPTRIFGLADVLSRGAEGIARLRPLHQEFLQAYRAHTMPGPVKRQFIVNGMGSQSVSTRPSSGTMPNFDVFGAPRHQRPQPGEVRKR